MRWRFKLNEVAVSPWKFPEEIVNKAAQCGATLPDLSGYEQVPMEDAPRRLNLSITPGQILLCPKGFSGDFGLAVKVLNGANNVVVFGAGASAKRSVVSMRGSGNIFCMGENALLRGAAISITDQGFCIFGRGATTNSGNRFVVRGRGGITMGDDCMFAAETMVRTWDSHGIFDRTTKQPINLPAGVDLQSHVWVGDNVTILKGASIGTHAVIATHSVVTKMVEPYSIAAGIPAKVVRRNVLWSRSRLWQDEPMYEDVAARFVELND